MQTRTTLSASPGACIACHRSDRDVFVELALGVPGYVPYLCGPCCARAAIEAGYRLLDPAVQQDLEEREARLAAGHNSTGELADAYDELVERHNALLQAVAHTLKNGAVIRGGKIDLRKVPGRRQAVSAHEA